MKGRHRNQPCWCGSGKKYKNCHRDRSGQTKDNPWSAVEVNKKAFESKKCFASGADLGECNGSIIKAHTVSKGPCLSKISEQGHVLGYRASVADLQKNSGQFVLTKIGINNASVFHGFCAKHDRDLFSCIENEPFIGRADQCLAVAYRTVSRERYGKDASSHLRETLRGADKGLELVDQYLLQQWLSDIDVGNSAARKDIAATHDLLTHALENGDYAILKSLVIEFDEVLPFMFAGAWSPFTDFYGRTIQDGFEDELLHQLIVSSFPNERGSKICLSWVNHPAAPGKTIADQIRQLPIEQIGSACFQLIAKHIENIFFRPSWINQLGSEQLKQISSLVADGVDLMGSVPSRELLPELDYSLPSCINVFDV